MKPAMCGDGRANRARNPVSRGRLGAASWWLVPGDRGWAAVPVLWENFPERGYLIT